MDETLTEVAISHNHDTLVIVCSMIVKLVPHIAPNFCGTIFREFRDLTSDHENFPHENLVLSLWWVWLCAVLCAHTAQRALGALVDSKHLHVRGLFAFTANGS